MSLDALALAAEAAERWVAEDHGIDGSLMPGARVVLEIILEHEESGRSCTWYTVERDSVSHPDFPGAGCRRILEALRGGMLVEDAPGAGPLPELRLTGTGRRLIDTLREARRA